MPTSATNATPVAVPANLLDGYGQDGRTDFRTASYAAFGKVNWRVVDRLTLTGSLRYTHEDKDAYYDTTVSGGPTATILALVNARLGVLRAQSYEAHDGDGSLSGRGNVAVDIADGVLGYASYARGFESGGSTCRGCG